MKLKPTQFSILILVFLLSSFSIPSAQEIKLNIQKTVLDNGLTILTYEDTTSEVVSYCTFVNAGSREEKPGTTGLAHVFEHMMFRGTDKFPDFDQATSKFGPQSNASTDNDYTMYFVNVKKDYLPQIIEIESDRIRNLRFDNQTFRTELGPIKEERRRFDVDRPDGFLYSQLYQLAYKIHPYHHPVVGFEEDLEKNIQIQDGLDFKNAFYSPSYCTIVIGGNFRTGQVLELIKKYYGDWAKTPSPDIKIPPEPEQTEERVLNLVWKDSQIIPKILIAYHGPNLNINTDDFCALKIIQKILFLRSGRLTKKLYKDLQLVESVDGSMNENKDPGLFVISATLKRGKSIDEVKGIILDEIEKIKNEPVSELELKKAKNSIKADRFYRMDHPSSIAYAIGHYQLLAGDYHILLEIDKKYESITPQIIQKVAQRIFVPTSRTTLTLIPKS